MPLLARGALTLNSPVDGLNKYCVLLVKMLSAVPLVEFKNAGNKSDAVLVSLLMADPPTEAQAPPLYPSNSEVVVLNRNCPAVPAVL